MNKAQDNFLKAHEAAVALCGEISAPELELRRATRATAQGIAPADYPQWLEDFNAHRAELTARAGTKTASELNAEKAKSTVDKSG